MASQQPAACRAERQRAASGAARPFRQPGLAHQPDLAHHSGLSRHWGRDAGERQPAAEAVRPCRRPGERAVGAELPAAGEAERLFRQPAAPDAVERPAGAAVHPSRARQRAVRRGAAGPAARRGARAVRAAPSVRPARTSRPAGAQGRRPAAAAGRRAAARLSAPAWVRAAARPWEPAAERVAAARPAARLGALHAGPERRRAARHAAEPRRAGDPCVRRPAGPSFPRLSPAQARPVPPPSVPFRHAPVCSRKATPRGPW